MAENKRDSIVKKLVPVAFFVFCSQRLIEPGNVPEGRKIEPDGSSYVYICTFTDRQVRITAECYEIPPLKKTKRTRIRIEVIPAVRPSHPLSAGIR